MEDSQLVYSCMRLLFLFINIIFLQFPVKCSFADAKVEGRIFSFAFMFFQRFNDQFFFLIHDIQAFLHFFMFMNIIMRVHATDAGCAWLVLR